MSLLQISSGRGPEECELAVGLYLERLLSGTPRAVVLESQGDREINLGGRKIRACRSLLVRLPEGAELPPLGTVKWTCKSPLRPNCGRRNWFFLVSEAAGNSQAEDDGQNRTAEVRRKDLRFETFRSPGKGGQNVNKVETGVRAVHLPTGLVAASTTARSQFSNKNLAIDRLVEKMSRRNQTQAAEIKKSRRTRHDELVRGNQVQSFAGLDFKPTEA
ncbi:MAG: peptide chain release factor-like protein [Deltaproteobacteria bacterium]|jgi:peptide chain release factor|nr:peptide chain release factor-like protein [Deltaproteobacteria bacterium]